MREFGGDTEFDDEAAEVAEAEVFAGSPV